MKTRFLSILLLSVLAFTSCDPSDDNPGSSNTTDEQFAQNFGAAVSRDFFGQVVDMNNHPIEGATVKIGTATVQTDVNGIFIFNDAGVREKFAYITVKKTGFIDGSRAMVPTSGKNNVKIMMIPATTVGMVTAGQTGEVTLSSGAKVVFDGAFEDEAGNDYSGSVNVSMFHLESSNENISSLMPGMLYGKDETGSQQALQSFGMLNVELRGSGGQKLQIKDGHQAQITFPIDDSQLATAPASIPLWHFDEVNGYWKQDGTATKQGNLYVATVSHFSWWNWDACFPVITLSIRLVDANGNPLVNVSVGIGVGPNPTNSSAFAWTDENGQISGLVPKDQPLLLNVYNNACNSVAYSQNIGPFSSDMTLPDITVNLSSQTALITGTLVKCDNTPVTNGYVGYRNGNLQGYLQLTNGNFSLNTLVCPNSNGDLRIKGFDLDNFHATDTLTYTITAPVTNIGNVIACNTITEYMTYKIDNLPVRYLVGFTAAGNGPEGFYLGANNNDYTLNIYPNSGMPGQLTAGEYTSAQLSIEGNEIYVNPNMTSNIIFQVNAIGAIGDYIDLTFSGTYIDPDDQLQHTVEGVAHIIRDN